MKLPLYVVDAFTRDDLPFTGNAAAVCILQYDDDISDQEKQKIASQMNLSETAFVAKAWNRDSATEENSFTLRWFTPTKEVDLCGHATLASAKAISDMLFNHRQSNSRLLRFDTKYKGIITARSDQDLFTINFPLNTSEILDRTQSWVNPIIRQVLGPKLNQEVVEDIEYSEGTKKILMRLKDVPNPEELMKLITPNFEQLMTTNTEDIVRGVIVTVRDKKVHFLSRYFTPWNGINEDPVTGAAHTVLAPYWKKQNERMGIVTQELIGYQCSQRGGIVICKIDGDRVDLTGKTRTFLSGTINI